MTSKRERPAGDGAPQRVTARRLNSLSPTSPKIEIQAHDAFVIKLAVTKDTFDGSPRPPDGAVHKEFDWGWYCRSSDTSPKIEIQGRSDQSH